MKTEISTRLWKKVEKTESCWVWKGGRNRDGYGSIWNGETKVLVHRLVYELLIGPIPEGSIVMHSCDNPSCVNPNHLSVGTHSLNAIDRESKGRGNQKTGENRANAKLTKEAVEIIVRNYIRRDPNYGQVALAKRFGVCPRTIQQVLEGRRWRHLLTSDDKTPTAATGEANSGIQEFAVGDEVKLPDIAAGTILSLNTDGTMAVGMLDGTVRHTDTQEVVKL